ncbi:MAG TPA: tRNA (adenosine(37)-N6)-threonylcarbamoyltransferase complex ATPase subunit type 1 TsaE [Bacteroidales bacterium]|nr:tRNA (adenosine(37)-N6)-threonylcarbamoyltransferase complex ATPase subunit type 1 TsaE [Bacteroidales bacterium]
MTQQLEINNLSELGIVAKALIPNLDESNIIAFYGAMGAGKTTLIKALCEQLKVIDEVSSPTFSIVNEYADQSGFVVYHFDFYRINHLEEVYDIGYENYFFSGYPCLIEWPEKIGQLLPEKHVKVTVEVSDSSEKRTFTIEMMPTNVI